jgi:hypothetical protein
MQQVVKNGASETLTLPSHVRRFWQLTVARRVVSGPKRPGWPEWCALVAYASLVAFAIPYHEPWADEAQAWQLARSLSLGALFKTYIRYEGSPGLWHFLLWIMVRLHIGYTGLHWICGAIATAGVSLLIFKSPFPRCLKLSFPFTYFLLFQYAVVARNYVLAPLLLFTLAIWWKRSPWIVTLMLGLLANTSLHLAVLSGGLALVYAVDELRDRGFADSARLRKLLLCALVLIAFYAFAIWTAWPPHDLALERVRGLASVSLRLLGSLALANCDPMFLSIPFWIVAVIWFYGRRKLLYLLPVLLFTLFSGGVYVAFWHAGLLVPFLIAALWMIWPDLETKLCGIDRISLFALGTLIFTQILWSGYALYRDHYFTYSPDAAAAEFLKPYVDERASIAVTYVKEDFFWRGHAFTSVGIQPYFDRNIYANTPFPFWWWSNLDTSEARLQAMLPSHPRFVIVEVVSPHPVGPPNLKDAVYMSLTEFGYQYRDTFCGTQPERLALGPTICHVIFEYPAGVGSSGK